MESKMKITFRDCGDKTKSKIFLNGTYLGYVQLDVWTQKWTMSPSFNLPYNLFDTRKDKFDSSYRAGKNMVELYSFLFPRAEEEQEFGISLNDMLVFLKTRK